MPVLPMWGSLRTLPGCQFELLHRWTPACGRCTLFAPPKVRQICWIHDIINAHAAAGPITFELAVGACASCKSCMRLTCNGPADLLCVADKRLRQFGTFSASLRFNRAPHNTLLGQSET